MFTLSTASHKQAQLNDDSAVFSIVDCLFFLEKALLDYHMTSCLGVI